MFYELLTGDILFKSDDLYRLCSDHDDLIPKEKFEQLDNNVYLIDFLNFMLIKDARLRPTISSVLKRFEHVYALLVVAGPSQFKLSSNKPYMTESTLIKYLEDSVTMLPLKHDKKLFLKNIDKSKINTQMISVNSVMSINESISYCSKHYLKVERNLINMNITHIVSMAPREELYFLNQSYDVLYINEISLNHNNEILEQDVNYPMILASIIDFMRKATIRKGKILFVEEDELLDTTAPKSLVGEYIILALSKIHHIPAYEVYTMIRNRNPVFDIAHSNLRLISTWCSKQLQIQNYLRSFPTLECLCGAC